MSSRELNGKEETGTNTRDFIAGAIVGGLAAAAVALLLAPKSGKELRLSINEQTTSIIEKTDKVKGRALTKSSELASVAKDKATSLAQTVSQQSHDLLHKVKHTNVQEENEHLGEDLPQKASIEQNHFATSEEIQRKLEETQKAFDETEQKMNH